MSFRVAVLAGDGIGPEIMEEGERILKACAKRFGFAIELTPADVGGAAIDKHGTALPEKTVTLCRNSNAILFGAVGGPKWESLPPAQQPERAALLPLRKIFGLFANLRPAIIFPQLRHASPLRLPENKPRLDVLVVRELIGGIYFGEPKGHEGDRAFDTMVYTRPEIERIAHVAFKAAMSRDKRLTSIDKANVLNSMVLWREVVTGVAVEYPDVHLRHMYVDNAAMQLIRDPYQFDVLLCGNMFGDILSDEAAMLTGSLGMLPSASLAEGAFGLYEPSGGSAPDIAGRGIANPIAQIISAAMMLKYSMGHNAAHDAVFAAVEKVLDEGYRTRDIAAPDESAATTAEMGARIEAIIRQG